MADDIDDLLDEVENTYLSKKKPEKKTQRVKETKNIASKPSSQPKPRNDDLDDMINDIISNDDLKDEADKCAKNSPTRNNSSTQPSQILGNSRCMPIYLGGTSTQLGLATAVNKRACNQLRCTDCDFEISSFDNYQWDQSTDYLFLRNNMPDLHRLKSKLLPRRGNRAYACQCKWLNVKDIKLLQDERQLKWFCGKH